ncbi:MAG TPA: 2-dehydropantoate 2-reductase [Stellaceae bacterium]
MRIAVFGTGGVGGYFGGRLAAAGNDVTFIARGAHLAAIRRDGLAVESANGAIRIAPAQATDDPAAIGPVDLVMLCVKLWDTEDTIAALPPLLGPDTAVVSFQNGIEAVPTLTARLSGTAARVLGGVAQIAAAIERPGVIRHTGTLARLIVGETGGGGDRTEQPRAASIVAAIQAAGIDALLSPDIGKAIWEKFVFLASFSGMTALTRLPKGPITAEPATRAMLAAAIGEACAVAQAHGAALASDHAERAMALVDKLPAEMKSSMLVDLEQGRRLELPWLSGATVRLGEAAGVATPVHGAIAAALAPYAQGRPQATAAAR